MTKTVGKEASTITGGLMFNTYQKLLKQRNRIDRELNKVQTKMFKSFSVKRGFTQREVYVPRMDNKSTLIEALHSCMTPKEEMTMKEILASLNKKSGYKTRSGYLYTMVNNKLNRDERIKKVRRGVFVYSPKKSA